MNLYFLVEGHQTERKVYPKWLEHLVPHLSQIRDSFLLCENDCLDNTFFLFDGAGYPSLLNHIEGSIKDINAIGRFDYFVICVDAEDSSVEERKQGIFDHIQNLNISLEKTQIVILVQNPCIETWMLGNRRVYLRTPQDPDLLRYTTHYNVMENDPELMSSINSEMNKAQFHEAYLKKMLAQRNISYTKRHPRGVVERSYLEELINRQHETNHLSSFSDFLNFCSSITAQPTINQ